MRTTHTLRLGAAVAVAALALAACGSDSGSGSGSTATAAGGFQVPDLKPLSALGTPEGKVSVLAWPGYVEDGSNDPAVDWVSDFEKETGCEVTVKTFGTSDEAVQLMRTGQYDVVSASGDATLRLIAGGDVEPVNTGLITELPGHLRVAEEPAVELGQRPDVRRPARPRRQPADVQQGCRVAGSRQLVGRVRPGLGAEGQGHRLRLADLHRRRRAVPQGHQARARHQGPLRARREAARRRRRPAQGAERATSASTGRTTSRRSRRSRPAPRPSAPPGRSSPTWPRPRRPTSRSCCPRRARPAGRTPGWSAPRARPRPAPTSSSTTSSRRRPTPPIAEYFGEAPANKKACAETADPNHCTTFHAEDEDYFSKVAYWNTPIKACLDGRTDVKCTDYADVDQGLDRDPQQLISPEPAPGPPEPLPEGPGATSPAPPLNHR